MHFANSIVWVSSVAAANSSNASSKSGQIMDRTVRLVDQASSPVLPSVMNPLIPFQLEFLMRNSRNERASKVASFSVAGSRPVIRTVSSVFAAFSSNSAGTGVKRSLRSLSFRVSSNRNNEIVAGCHFSGSLPAKSNQWAGSPWMSSSLHKREFSRYAAISFRLSFWLKREMSSLSSQSIAIMHPFARLN